MEVWTLVVVLVLVLSAFPFLFANLAPALRSTLFYVYISVLLVTAGTLGALFALPLAGRATVSFGNLVYTAVIMSTMMMFVVAGDLRVVRNTIRLVVVVNLFVLVVLGATSVALETGSVIDPFGTSAELFRVPILSALIGGALNVVQLLLIGLALERAKALRDRWRVVGAHLAVFVGVLALDGVAFPTLLLLAEPGFQGLIGSASAGLLGSLLLAGTFALPLGVFLLRSSSELDRFQRTPTSLRELFRAPRDELLAQLEEQRSELSERDALVRIAGDVAQLGGWVLHLPNRRVEWSAASQERFGLVGRGPRSLDEALRVHPTGAREQLRAALERCIDAGDPVDLELPATLADGATGWIRVVARREVDPDGVPTRLVGAHQDVSERRATEEEAERLTRRLHETLESMTDGLLILDEDGRFSYVNRSAEQLFGASRESLLGEVMDARLPQRQDSAFHRAAARAVETGQPQRVIAFADHLGRWIEADGYPSDLGLVVYFRDVTDRVAREHRLEQLAEAEQAAAERFRHLNRAKDTFLTAVSHELRTPLTVVQGMAQTLQRLREDDVAPHRTRMIDALASNAERLALLLDDLLDIDRLTRDALEISPTPFDVVPRTERLIAEARVAPRVEADLPDHLEVVADPVRYDRILANLLDNAHKYAPDGPIRVQLRTYGERGLRLEVADEGPGIPDDLRAGMFDPFHRGDDDHPQPGTGIGLTLVAEFAQLHGGRAYARDTDGRGAHLVVELPGTLGTSAPNGPDPADPER